jgi:hypothetical protein
MCCCKTTERSSSQQGPSASTAPNCPTGGQCPPPCNSATIRRPLGSLDNASNPVASWLTSPCFHFDFQGVISGSAGPYVLAIDGAVAPAPYTCQWALDAAAGTLTSPTSNTPTHVAPAAAGDGNLTLTGVNGTTPASCTDRRRIRIYLDHLARDQENYGVGTSCRGPTWTFTRFGATISMSGQWNCHGGTRHIYNGTGSGSEGPGGVAFLLDPSRLKNTVHVTHTPTGGGTHPPLGPLVRGDIVAYYTGSGDLAHTQTCTGNGTETYGANNVPVAFPGRPNLDEAWRWSTSTAGDWANNIRENIFPGATPFTIKVFSRP